MQESIETVTTELEERLRFETLLAEISSHFINVPAGEVDCEIEDAQRRISEFLNLERSLGQVPERGPGALLFTHMQQPQGGSPIPERPNATHLFPWTTRKVLAGETVIIRWSASLTVRSVNPNFQRR